MRRAFTGWHMAGIMIAFFALIVAVNALMATYAVSTFGGKVVENSYVAGQRYNGWLRQARAQRALGWAVELGRTPDRRISATVSAGDSRLTDARVEGVASHPVGREDDVALRFAAAGGGRYVSDRPLPAGRWDVHLTVTSGADTLRLIESVR